MKTIPRAVIASLLLTGAFFVFITYVETHALADNVPTLDKLDAPLSTLSENLGVKWMGVLISIGAMISFFALAMSCLNAGARVMFTMGRYGIFPISMGSSHKHNLTPHVAISVFAVIQFLIPTRSFSCPTPPWAAGRWRRSTLSTTPGFSAPWAFAGRTY